MKKALALYSVGIAAVGLAIWKPALGWLSPVVIGLVFPVCAFWFWRIERRPFPNLGQSRAPFWRQALGWGLFLGVLIPLLITLVELLFGWVVLTPTLANLAYANLPLYFTVPVYIAYVLVKMVFIVAIEEFVFRGYFLQRLSLGMGVGWAVLLSSALWGIGHLASMVSQGLAVFPTMLGMLTFILWGTAESLGSLRTGKTLWFPFGLHYGVNISFSLLGGFFLTSFHAPEWLLGNPAWSPESGVLGTLAWLAAIGLVWLITFLPRFRQKPAAIVEA